MAFLAAPSSSVYPDYMAGDGFWADVSQKLFSVVSKEEVKTPLSFCFRLSLLVLLLTVLAICTTDSPEFRFKVFIVAISAFLVIWIGVCIFAWFKPKNLVFGESGHRAETKFAYGNEKNTISYAQASALPGAPTLELTQAKELPEAKA